ncbi:cytochrome c oxidase accessory protein CcoG [Sphingobacterium deserti]|uniref:Cytochrome c oxidase accessory protein CcoG n=1 Tax=Sphingobacterium deserti TaxID=1229276 RepID=A0A0B8T303_9SPHI|nr:cytochrome c oxidase accessory protein CcoG [Sphingobacterium deserti]KGE15807.1 cytochrome c oxidase accessory protein CcoG [Sphingobacterium deserti]
MRTVPAENGKQVQGLQGKRKWIYAKKPKGRFYLYRQWVGYPLLLFFFAAPFIKINGNPFLMFNIIERKFSIVGHLFYPQDLYIFVFGMLIVMIGILLFTVVYGRVWCGWTCPQTIFMELVFRRIEYWIEGDWQQQKKLNEGPDSDARAWKKFLKHSIFFALSFLIANTFLAYIIGIGPLAQIIVDPVSKHLAGFTAILLFALIFYAVFAHVREIVCTTICPYGRLQSVLLDDQSLTVAYDLHRGEPRGKIQKNQSAQGDCVDCKLCVNVCPTGIDIRNGLQMECVSCTACIDACDAVMDKVGKPKGLIGFYATAEALDKPSFKKKNMRALAYSSVLAFLVIVFAVLLFNRSVIGGSLLRANGSSYHLKADGTVGNLYTLELLNKSGNEMEFELQAADPRYSVQQVNPIHLLKKDGTATLSFFLYIDRNDVTQYKQNIKVKLVSKGKSVYVMKTTFIAPLPSN